MLFARAKKVRKSNKRRFIQSLWAAAVALTPHPSSAQVAANDPWRPQTGNRQRPVVVQLKADKEKYAVGEKLQTHVCLTNVTKSSIYVYRTFEWSVAGISMWVRDAIAQRNIPATVVADLLPPPPTSRHAFEVIRPGQCHDITIDTTISELNVTRAGKYQIIASYHSPIPASMSFGLPIVSRENGTLFSNIVSIVVQ